MRPLVAVLLSFLAGIVFSNSTDLSYRSAAVAFGAVFILLFLGMRRGARFRRYLTLPLYFFLGAIFILPHIRPVHPPYHITNLMGTSSGGGTERMGDDVEGVVVSSETRRGSTRLRVRAERIHLASGWTRTSGDVKLRVEGTAKRFIPGDTVRFLSRIREPWNYGNPGEFDYKGWLNMRGVYASGKVTSDRLIIKTEGARGASTYVARARERLGGFIDAHAINAGVLKAMVTGEKGEIDPGLTEAFAVTGTAHVLAISGLHAGIAALFSFTVFFLLLKRSERLMLAINAKKAAALLSLVPLLAYGALSGFSLSTQRAVIMAAAFVVTFVIGRGRDYYNTLALAALVILAYAPYSVWDVSFQLSFAAAFMIVYLTPRIKELVEGEYPAPPPAGRSFITSWLRRRVLPLLYLTIAAGIAVSPILAYHFNRVSLVGFVANLVVVPIIGVIVPLLLVCAALLPFSEGLSWFILSGADALASLMTWLVRLFAAPPYSSIPVSTPTLTEICLFYALVICIANLRRARTYAYVAVAVVLVLAADQGLVAYRARGDSLLKVTFISVGQGDAALMEFPRGSTMLIDGGPRYASGFDVGKSVVAPLLRRKRIRKIDYLVLTHPQVDHMGGLGFIARNFRIGEFWSNGEPGTPGIGGAVGAGELGRALEENKIETRVVGASTKKLNIDGVTVEVLHPNGSAPPASLAGLDVNNRSLVIRLTYGKKAFLFTGDIGYPAEAMLVSRDIKADVVKVAHHGSRYSSSTPFIDKVGASLAVFSLGRHNGFGFPHGETVLRYAARARHIYRTDLDGAVTVTTDGETLRAAAYLTGEQR